jgi:hypothetical protein
MLAGMIAGSPLDGDILKEPLPCPLAEQEAAFLGLGSRCGSTVQATAMLALMVDDSVALLSVSQRILQRGL